MVCFVKGIYHAIESNIEIEHYFSSIVWVLNFLLLFLFLIELRLRGVKCMKKIPHTYLMVLLSMISSVISSTFFLISQAHFFFHTQYIINKTCLFGPVVAISFRTIAKHFTWAFYIIRGQMVMESMDTKSTTIVKKAPYMLLVQCIVITTLIIIFTQPQYHFPSDSCTVFFPVSLLICSALFGELFYGLGFMYIFYKAMSVSMDHVYNSISKRHAASIKTQIRHHIRVYSVQLITSLSFICFVSLCLCFDTLVFFEAELFISNLCLMSLFRNKKKIFRKLCGPKTRKAAKKDVTTPVRPRSTSDNGTLVGVVAPYASARSHSDLRGTSNANLRPTDGKIKQFVHSAVLSENFLSDNWRTNATVHNVKAALKLAEAAPKLNSKALEMLGVTTANGKSPRHANKHTKHSTSIEEIINVTFDKETDRKYALSAQSKSNPLSKAYHDEMKEEEEEAPSPFHMNLHRSVSEKTPEAENMKLHLAKPSFDNIGTKSEPLFVQQISKTNKGQNSPSVHLLEEKSDLMTAVKLQQNTSIISKFKKGMKRMSLQINAAPITLSFGGNKMEKKKNTNVGNKDKEEEEVAGSPKSNGNTEPPDSVYINNDTIAGNHVTIN